MKLNLAMAVAVGALTFGTAAGNSDAAPLLAPQSPAQPQEYGANCGVLPRSGNLELWNYDTTKVSCAQAAKVMNIFLDYGQQHAFIGGWSCDRNPVRGVAVQCKGPGGLLRLN